MKIKTLILAFFTLTFLLSYGKSISVHKGEVKNGYNFWLYEPENTDTIKPVIIFLHGASLCGNNLEKVKRYGTIDAIEKGRDIDAFVIAPQNPGGAWNPEKIMNILEWVESRYKTDPNRVYVIGMSLGGYGTLSFSTQYPNRVTAAIAICGGNTFKDSSPLNNVPLWIVHGTADRAVSIAQSDKVVESMKQTHPELPRLIYNRVPGMNHSQPARMFYMPQTYEWLFSHSLKDENRPVSKPVELSSNVLKEAYNGLNFSSSSRSKSGKSNYSKKSSKKSRKKSSSVKASSGKKSISGKSSSKKKTTSKKKK